MNIFKVAYLAPFSNNVLERIRDNITYSMISNDESSCQYHMSQVRECVNDYGTEDDVKLYERLENKGVDYIEF